MNSHAAAAPPFIRTWRFRPVAGAREEFELVYGPDGSWVRLFQLHPGFVGTELQRIPDDSGDYVTVDRWTSRAAWESFRRTHAAAYESLDEQCTRLIESEWLVEESARGAMDPDGAP